MTKKAHGIAVQKDIRFKTIETPIAWLVFAVLIEHVDGQIVVSEPRLIKVVQKKLQALKGKVHTLSLSASKAKSSKVSSQKVVSPYVSFFTNTESGILAWCGARPPTF